MPLVKTSRDKKNISAFSLHFGERTAVAALLFPCVYVCPDYITAMNALEQFSSLTNKAVLLLGRDDVLSYHKARSQEGNYRRVAAMTEIVSERADVIIVNPEALVQLYPDPQVFKSNIRTYKKNEEYDQGDIVSFLVGAGYKREAQITAKGHFSLRGDILDIWAPNSDGGVRLEFFGDTLETIKSFDIGEQTAKTELDEIEICPAGEVFYEDGQAYELIKQVKENLPRSGELLQRSESILSGISLSLSALERSMSLAVLLPLLKTCSFSQFVLPQRVIFDEAKMIFDNVSVLYIEHENRYKNLFMRGEVLKCAIGQFIDKEKVFDIKCPKIAFHKLTSANRLFNPDAVFNFNSFPIPNYTKNYEALIDDVNGWMSQNYRIILFAGSQGVKENLIRLFDTHHVGFNVGGGGYLEILPDRLPTGAVFHYEKLVLIGTDNLVVKSVKKIIKRNKSDVFSEPEVGSYVVHAVHGIGFCEAVTRLEVNGASRDYFVVSYRCGDKLYVPIENMDSLTKFVSGDETPRLSKIGGSDFAKVKEKVKASVKKMAFSLLDLYAERKAARGHKYSGDSAFYDEFCLSFPYRETDDQLEAAAEGLKDLTDGKIMDRLLCGDVGYGKTEVALRIAFKVITEGKQAAFISPTTILARQHFNTVKKRMEPFGVRIGSLTRFDSDAEIKRTLEKLASKQLDIVVGTHRVLSADVVFSDLGLLILDEEQRFGVADKEKIKKLKNNVNVLTLSATPIPRTLHMSMVGIRDISVLDTPPENRVPVQTVVTEYTQSLLADAVTREVNRGGQVFIVYNRVETIDKFAGSVQSILPGIKIAVAHGQMQEGRLEDIIASFVGGGADVLIATTIIENGIDMPNANTMIVIDSDRFGLSQLYQLRGRVGRSDRLAYVYFTFDPRKILTETAYRRLDAITEYTEFGSGFKIAMRDLEIRGAGNILGAEQHGHIEKVGYDMYCKLLESAVKELSGQGAQEKNEKEVKVNTDFNAFIPDNYIPDNEWRIRAYSRVSRISTNEERVRFTKDLTDIYGKVPSSVENLLIVALVKNLAASINAVSVTLKKNECSLNFNKVQDIPQNAAILAQNRLKAQSAKIDFGSARSDMIIFLLACTKK